MVEAYYILLALILLITLPLGVKKRVFAYSRLESASDENKPLSYTPLAGMGKSKKNAIYLIWGLVLAFLVAICVGRDELMPDYLMYQALYDGGGQTNSRRDLEPSFVWITQFSPNFYILLFVYAFLSVGLHLYGIIRNAPNLWLSLGLYLGYTFVLHDMVQMRAAVSAGILLIGIRYIQQRNWKVYFLLCIIAYFFHYSASIFFFLYFLPKKNMNRWFWAAVLLLAMAFSVFGVQIGTFSRLLPFKFIDNYLRAYLGAKNFSESETGPARIAMCMLLLYMIMNIKKYQKVYPYATISVAIYTCSMLAYLLFGDIPVLQGRMGELLGVAGIFMWAAFPMISKRYYYLLCGIPILLAIYYAMGMYPLLAGEV